MSSEACRRVFLPLFHYFWFLRQARDDSTLHSARYRLYLISVTLPPIGILISSHQSGGHIDALRTMVLKQTIGKRNHCRAVQRDAF